MANPEVRFKDENGNEFPEWEESTIGAVCDSVSYGMNAAAKAYDGENKYIRITDIDEDTHLYSSKDIVSPDGVLDDCYLLKENDLLFARTGASTGKTYIYRKEDGKLYFAGFLIRARINEAYNGYFVYYQTLTEKYWNWVRVMSVRSGQPGINGQEYASLKIKVPSKDEQAKIASFFFEIDNLIKAQQDKIDSYKQSKKAMMQKLFSQEVRFKKDDGSDFEDWEEIRFGSTFTSFSGGTPKVGVSDYYEAGTINFIRSGEIHSNSTELKITEEGLKNSSAKLVHSGDLLLALYGATAGEIDISQMDGAINQAILCIIPKVAYNAKYLESLWLSHKEEVLLTYLQGGQGNLSAEIVKSLVFNMSSNIAEQTQIATLLTEYDDLIKAAEGKLEAYKQFKKAMMQKMFV